MVCDERFEWRSSGDYWALSVAVEYWSIIVFHYEHSKYLRLQFVIVIFAIWTSSGDRAPHTKKKKTTNVSLFIFSIHFENGNDSLFEASDGIKLFLCCWYLFLDPFCNDGEWWRLLNSHMSYIHKRLTGGRFCSLPSHRCHSFAVEKKLHVVHAK